MTDQQPRQLSRAEQIAALLDTFGLVNGWTLIAEVIDEDGKACLWNFRQDRQSNWTTAGLLHHAQLDNDGRIYKAIAGAK